MKASFPIALTLILSVFLGYWGCATSNVATIQSVSGTGPTDKIVEQFEAKSVDSLAENAVSLSPANPSGFVTPAPSPNPGSTKESKAEVRKRKALEKKTLQEAKAVEVSAESSKKGSKIDDSGFKIPNRRPAKMPFWIGENQVLDITYLGMVAGQFELELLPMKVINQRKVYHFEGRAKSSSLFNIVYSLNDKIESFMDFQGLFSYKFHMLLDQTRQKRDSLELYDHEKKQAYYWNRKNHVTKGYSEIKEYKPIESLTQDSFSAYHYLRTLPLETGKHYSMPVVSEGNSWEAVATVLRREIVSTPLGKFPAIVVRPQTRFQGVLKQGSGESFIWLSDDDRRFILQFEAKVKIGSVIGVIKKIVPGEKPAENE